jgi:hypothetical protein
MGNMLSFNSFITESTLSTGNLTKAKSLIQSYLDKKLGEKGFSTAGVEKGTNKFGKFIALRYYFPRSKRSLRFNWSSASATEHNLTSIDLFAGKRDAAFHIDFSSEISIIRILPMIAKIMSGKEKIKQGEFRLPPAGTILTESTDIDSLLLLETYDMSVAFDDTIKMFKASENGKKKFNQSMVLVKYKTAGKRMLEKMAEMHPSAFTTSWGMKFVGDKKAIKEIEKNKDKILDTIESTRAKVSKGGSDSYATDAEVEEIENNREKIAFEEQLKHMEELLKMMVAGASNAMFVAGRGGIGKTHTVEKVLSSLGLSDGNGYFKNTGSASAAGIYSLLFKYKDEIVFFDDSDDALKDQESRNIFKAATDTKKVRKLVWSKKGSNVVDPDEASDDEILDMGKIPQFFEFTGKVVFISNLPMKKLDPDGALRTRAFMIDIDPTEDEIFDFMEKIADAIPVPDGMSLARKRRLEVIDIMRKGKSKQSANLRKLSRGFAMAAGADAQGIKDIEKLIDLYA